MHPQLFRGLIGLPAIQDLDDHHWQNIAKGGVLLATIILDNRLHPWDEETARQGDGSA